LWKAPGTGGRITVEEGEGAGVRVAVRIKR
jgi:hypothetical protein